MKVPFPSNTTSKPDLVTSTATAAAAFEPKSVLDLRRSPSPPSEKPADPLSVDHALINHHLVDWDSLMSDLGLNDDSTPLHKPTDTSPELPPVTNSFDPTHLGPSDLGQLLSVSNIPTYSFDVDCVDELIRLAECFDTNSVQLGHVILARLNRRLTSPAGKPLQRAAFYFKEALQSHLTGSTRTPRVATSSEIVQTIKAQKAFAAISPIPLFSTFTANQALLESLDSSSASIVHVIDFDIGLGGHWASFMKELAGRRSGFAGLRVSALVSEEYANESRLVRENLTQFARDVNVGFEIEFVLIRNFEYLSLEAIRFAEGEMVAVLLSPAVFRQVGTGFLNNLRRVSPHVVVVHVDTTGATSYRQTVIDGLEFYSTLMETLEAANFNGVDDWMRRIETFVVFPKILEEVGRRGTWWREALLGAGLRQVEPSQFAEFQGECLLRRVQVQGFHVIRQQAELVLCWHDRPIVATSAWRY